MAIKRKRYVETLSLLITPNQPSTARADSGQPSAACPTLTQGLGCPQAADKAWPASSASSLPTPSPFQSHWHPALSLRVLHCTGPTHHVNMNKCSWSSLWASAFPPEAFLECLSLGLHPPLCSHCTCWLEHDLYFSFHSYFSLCLHCL